MDLLNPVALCLSGANINRHTVETVRLSGLSVTSVEGMDRMGLLTLITPQPALTPHQVDVLVYVNLQPQPSPLL